MGVLPKLVGKRTSDQTEEFCVDTEEWEGASKRGMPVRPCTLPDRNCTSHV